MNASFILAAMTATCLVSALPARADDDDDDDRRYHRAGYDQLSDLDALDIAAQYGLDRIKEIKFSNESWEIEGCTADGEEIEIDISAHTADIRKLEYEDDDAC